MSYKYGMSALNLEMTDKVPRTEYSAESHWELIKAVTGVDVGADSGDDTKTRARKAFLRAWDYSFRWNILISSDHIPGRKTTMGHAVYAAGGVDYDDNIQCPFKDVEEVLNFDPMQEYGGIDIPQATQNFDAHYQSAVQYYGDAVNMTGIYITCMSGLIEMFGWEMLLLAAGHDPKAFGSMTNRYCEWIGQYFAALAKCSAPVIMIHDDIVWTQGAFIHPDWYREYVFKNYKINFAPLIEAGKKIIYTSDGNYTQFIDDIAPLVNCFVLEPTTCMQYIADKYGKTHSFIGNADTRVLLQGTKQDIYREVKRCMDIGKKHAGFFMAVGNHIPANTPVDNALYYNQAYEQMSRR